MARVSQQLAVNKDTLRNWVGQAEIDAGLRSGATMAEQRRINELEREVRELRRANEILKSASAFFASVSGVERSTGNQPVTESAAETAEMLA